MNAKLMAVTAAALFATPLTVSAQAANSDVAGTYVYDGKASAVDDAIESLVAKMSFIKRPIARSRLKRTNPISQHIAISRTAESIELILDRHTRVRMPADGTPTKWKRDDGELLDASALWSEARLVQTFKAEDGQRTSTYRLQPNGDIMLDVAVTSDQLPKPLTYSLHYRRER